MAQGVSDGDQIDASLEQPRGISVAQIMEGEILNASSLDGVLECLPDRAKRLAIVGEDPALGLVVAIFVERSMINQKP